MADLSTHEQRVLANWSVLSSGVLLHETLPVIVINTRGRNGLIEYGFRLWTGEGEKPRYDYLTNVCLDAAAAAQRRMSEFEKLRLTGDLDAAEKFRSDLLEEDWKAKEAAAIADKKLRDAEIKARQDAVIRASGDRTDPRFLSLLVDDICTRIEKCAEESAQRLEALVPPKD